MKEEEIYKIHLDLDKDRIRTVLSETYKTCQDMLNIEFDTSEKVFVAQIDKYLDSNRVTLPVTVYLPSLRYPDLRFDVNLRKKSIIARMKHRKKRIYINRFLTKL